jgi:hypothetical protein
VREDLGDHRVVLGGDPVALGDAGVDPDPGTGREGQQLDAAGSGCEPTLRVLGVEPHLDGVAGGGGRVLRWESLAGSDAQLPLDQIEPGGQLRHRMLDLEPGVDLEEGRETGRGLVEELDGAGTAVGGRAGQGRGCGPQVGVLLGGQGRGGRLLQDLLVAALQRAVARPGGPHRTLPVGEDLDLDVSRPGQHALQEHGLVPEGRTGLGARACERGLERVEIATHADAAASATGCRLDHQGDADALRMLAGCLEVIDGAVAPRRDGHPGAFGEQLGADLVAERTHRVPGGADEGDAELLASVGEVGVLGDEPPADPGGVDVGCLECARELVVVEVGGPGPRRLARTGSDADRVVGLPDEHGVPLRVGVQRDRAGSGPIGVAEGAHGVDQPHRRFASVDDGDALEHAGLLVRHGVRPVTRQRGVRPRAGAILDLTSTSASGPLAGGRATSGAFVVRCLTAFVGGCGLTGFEGG